MIKTLDIPIGSKLKIPRNSIIHILESHLNVCNAFYFELVKFGNRCSSPSCTTSFEFNCKGYRFIFKCCECKTVLQETCAGTAGGYFLYEDIILPTDVTFLKLLDLQDFLV